MKPLKILLSIFILLSLLFIAPALSVFQSITNEPLGWQAGIDMSSTIVWIAVIIIGYGYLVLQSILAIFGLFFGFKTRRRAFWLFVLPGFFGIIIGLASLGLFATYDAEWPASWPIIAILLALPITTFVTGRIIRKKLPSVKKKKK